MLNRVYKLALASAVALFAETLVAADSNEKTGPEIDTTSIDGSIRGLAFLRDNKTLVVAEFTRILLFQVYPTFERSSIVLDQVDLSPNAISVRENGYMYVVGTSLKNQRGRLLVIDPTLLPGDAILDSQSKALLYNVTLERLFSYPFVFVSQTGRVVMSDLASGSVSVFEERDFENSESTSGNGAKIAKYVPVRLSRNPPVVVALECGPAQQAAVVRPGNAEEEFILASPFGGAKIERIPLSGSVGRCDPWLEVKSSPSEQKKLATTLSQAVVGSGELTLFGSVEADALIVVDHGKMISEGTGLGFDRVDAEGPSVKGDIHVVTDGMGRTIAVGSRLVAGVAVFRYAEGKIERLGTGWINHAVDAAAISPDGAVVAVAGSKGGQGVITLLRNPLALQDGKVDYRRPFTNRWAQRALEAQGYDPGEVDGIIGPRTIGAIKRFQAANEIVVDGRLNAETLKLLYVINASTDTEEQR